MRMGGELCIIVSVHFSRKKNMATSQGGVSAAAAPPQSAHTAAAAGGAAPWSPQQQHLTARSLERALDDAVCSGILNLSGRKLREYPGLSYDLTDTTEAGERSSPPLLSPLLSSSPPSAPAPLQNRRLLCRTAHVLQLDPGNAWQCTDLIVQNHGIVCPNRQYFEGKFPFSGPDQRNSIRYAPPVYTLVAFF